MSEEGRLQRVILLLYHPLCADGQMDLDDLHSLALPALEEQTDLLEILQAPDATDMIPFAPGLAVRPLAVQDGEVTAAVVNHLLLRAL